MLRLLREVVDDQHQSVVLVTHDPVVGSYADEVMFLADGLVRGELTAPTAQTIAARMTSLEELVSSEVSDG